MKVGLFIGGMVLVVVGLVLGALVVGWALWGRQAWTARLPVEVSPGETARGLPVPAGPGFCGGMGGWRWTPPATPGYDPGTGQTSPWGPGMCGGAGWWRTVPASGTLTIEQARDAVERSIAQWGLPNLEVEEVMEFEYNFYAIIQESDTGIGAMEVLVDKVTGAVYPEMGPNMMWNQRYGMHRWVGGATTITPDEAKQIAQRWLDAYRPGEKVEDVDPFYGYYTIHTEKDGQIVGMLSVHGSTGQVWYHTWHGRFIQMLEEE